MWYFAWILGLGLALTFAILNGLWHELHESQAVPVTGAAPDEHPGPAGAVRRSYTNPLRS